MIASKIQRNELPKSRLGRGGEFRPDDYFATALERVYRVSGMAMYRVLDHPACRTRLQDLVGRVERAWRQGERTDRWAAFGRSVDRMKWAWLEMLDADVATTPPSQRKGADHGRD